VTSAAWRTRARTATAIVLVLAVITLGSLAGSGLSTAPTHAASRVIETPAASAARALGQPASAVVPSAGSATGSHGSGADAGSWNSNFFHDIAVTFSGAGLPGQFQPVPYTNALPITTLGFWLNISSLDPLQFANVTIWGTQWPTTAGVAQPITGYLPSQPNVQPMLINHTVPNVASYFFDTYRFFWPGSTVYFNVSAVGVNATPSEVKSSTNDSVPITYTGGYTDLATWAFSVDSPWASGNFSDDIAVSTTPNVLGTVPYAPDADQAFTVTISAIDLGGTVAPIPDAVLQYTISVNDSVASYSEPFGPLNHTVMSLDAPLGPYPGANLKFNVSAWLPWEDGALDQIVSPTYNFTWSPQGGWWHPTQGLLANLELGATPDVLIGSSSGTGPIDVATDQPVNISIHEPVENVTISSAAIDFTFSDSGLTHSGSLAMTSLGDNTSYALLPGLPPGASVTFYVVAKDIDGNPISSGNFSYLEVGPTNPPLPAGRGLVFIEVLDLSFGTLVPGFPFTISNATWSESGSAVTLGFATARLPGTGTAYELRFGTYDVSVNAFGAIRSALVSISASSPTPTIVFYGESVPAPITTTGSLPVESIAAAIGLAAAAIATVPLSSWLDERRAKHAEEQRRVTL
jgi:hypothetical protein